MCYTGLMAQSVCVIVSAADQKRLEAIVADRNQRQKYVERARIVLASADRGPAQRVAQSIGVSRPTVWRWQQRFAESGVEGLLRDKTRKPGKAPIAAQTTARILPRAAAYSSGWYGWPKYPRRPPGIRGKRPNVVAA